MRSGSKQVGKRISVTSVNFQSIRSRTVIAPTIVIGCLKISLLTAVKAICTTRVSLVMRERQNAELNAINQALVVRALAVARLGPLAAAPHLPPARTADVLGNPQP